MRRDRLVLTVELSPECPHETTPELARALVRAVPTLPMHDCVNDKGPSFGDVLAKTSVPHVLEHLVIDAQARAAADASAAGAAALGAAGADGDEAPRFLGTTLWLDEDAGLARVEVSYRDDIAALAAVKRALATLNAALAAVR